MTTTMKLHRKRLLLASCSQHGRTELLPFDSGIIMALVVRVMVATPQQ